MIRSFRVSDTQPEYASIHVKFSCTIPRSIGSGPGLGFRQNKRKTRGRKQNGHSRVSFDIVQSYVRKYLPCFVTLCQLQISCYVNTSESGKNILFIAELYLDIENAVPAVAHTDVEPDAVCVNWCFEIDFLDRIRNLPDFQFGKGEMKQFEQQVGVCRHDFTENKGIPYTCFFPFLFQSLRSGRWGKWESYKCMRHCFPRPGQVLLESPDRCLQRTKIFKVGIEPRNLSSNFLVPTQLWVTCLIQVIYIWYWINDPINIIQFFNENVH